MSRASALRSAAETLVDACEGQPDGDLAAAVGGVAVYLLALAGELEAEEAEEGECEVTNCGRPWTDLVDGRALCGEHGGDYRAFRGLPSW